MYRFNGLVIECVHSTAWPLNLHIQWQTAIECVHSIGLHVECVHSTTIVIECVYVLQKLK